jgi:hypothetical protein
VDAQTLDGEIRIETEGPARARTGSGDVSAWVGAEADAATVIETGSGKVWLSLPEAASDVQVETGGQVTSAVSLKEEPGPAGRRRLAAKGGQGVPPVIVRSETGTVEIVQRRR